MNWVCLHGLWDKPEYVPYRIVIIRGDSTFSGKNIASLGCLVLRSSSGTYPEEEYDFTIGNAKIPGFLAGKVMFFTCFAWFSSAGSHL